MRIGNRTVHTKSTGTTDAMAAKRFAQDLYAECMMRRRYGDVLPSSDGNAANPIHCFDKVAGDWLDQKRAIAGSDVRKLRAYDDARKLLSAPNGLGAFFKRQDIISITTEMVREYLCFAAEHSKKGQLATTTQRNHLSALNGILKLAAERRIIAAPPPMPRLRLKDNPRPCFTDLELRGLWLSAGFLGSSASHRGDIKAAGDFAEFQDFLTFMIATFLRPAEWKQLRQKHCRIVGGDHPYLEVAVPNGKTGIRKVVSMPEAIDVFNNILERDGDDPERFLFRAAYQNRNTAYERMRDLYEAALAESGFGLDEFRKKRTMYSLRHTALMFRLLYGQNVDLLMLARNAGTGVDQLERFYLSHADPAMKVENLHSMKPIPEEPDYDLREEEPRSAINLEAALAEPHCEPAA